MRDLALTVAATCSLALGVTGFAVAAFLPADAAGLLFAALVSGVAALLLAGYGR